MRATRFLALCVVVGLLGSCSGMGKALAGLPPGYSITDTGMLSGGAFSEPYGINDAGQVVGACNVPGLGPRGYLWDNGTMTDLGQGCANSINKHSQIVGGDFHGGWINETGYLWQNGSRINLSMGAFDINSAGLVVGQGRGYNNQVHAVMWQQGTMADLFPLFAEASCATGVNDTGSIVGWAATSLSPIRFEGFLWRNGFTLDLGYLGRGAVTLGINAHDQVVGCAEKTIQVGGQDLIVSRAFSWENGVRTDLETPSGSYGSRAYAVNDAGQIVGTESGKACIWDGGRLYYLQDLVVDGPPLWEGATAWDINNMGQIVVGTSLLTPIPEPATLALLALGGLVALRRRR